MRVAVVQKCRAVVEETTYYNVADDLAEVFQQTPGPEREAFLWEHGTEADYESEVLELFDTIDVKVEVRS